MVITAIDSVLKDFLQEIRERRTPDEHAMGSRYDRIDMLDVCARSWPSNSWVAGPVIKSLSPMTSSKRRRFSLILFGSFSAFLNSSPRTERRVG